MNLFDLEMAVRTGIFPEPDVMADTEYKFSGSQLADYVGKVRAAMFAPITMQDVRLVTGEGTLVRRHILDAVNIILRQRSECVLPKSE